VELNFVITLRLFFAGSKKKNAFFLCPQVEAIVRHQEDKRKQHAEFSKHKEEMTQKHEAVVQVIQNIN
jgi:hypothetical protein